MSVRLSVINDYSRVYFDTIPRAQVDLKLISFKFSQFQQVSVTGLCLTIQPDLEHFPPNDMKFTIDLIKGDLQVTLDKKENYYFDSNHIYDASWFPELTFKDGTSCKLDYEAIFSVSYR